MINYIDIAKFFIIINLKLNKMIHKNNISYTLKTNSGTNTTVATSGSERSYRKSFFKDSSSLELVLKDRTVTTAKIPGVLKIESSDQLHAFQQIITGGNAHAKGNLSPYEELDLSAICVDSFNIASLELVLNFFSPHVVKLEIGNISLVTLNLKNFPNLKYLKVGNLKEGKIHQGTLTHFSKLEVTGNPQLEEMVVGDIDYHSQLMVGDVPKLIKMNIGDVYSKSEELILKDLPVKKMAIRNLHISWTLDNFLELEELQIRLVYRSCFIEIVKLPKLEKLIIGSYDVLAIKDLPKLKYLNLGYGGDGRLTLRNLPLLEKPITERIPELVLEGNISFTEAQLRDTKVTEIQDNSIQRRLAENQGNSVELHASFQRYCYYIAFFLLLVSFIKLMVS